MSVHPATLLALWVATAVLAQFLGLAGLALSVAVAVPLALTWARTRVGSLLRRSRWLMLSIVVLFTFGTPGERLPGAIGDLGVSYDGLLAAGEQVLRLTLLLVTLASLHERVGSQGIVAGLHRMLAPLAMFGDVRERLVVRLLLVLENVDGGQRLTWRQWLTEPAADGPDRLALADGRFSRADAIALVAGAAALLAFLAYR